jgi:hypothetical protein
VSPKLATLAVVYDARRCADGAVGSDEVAAYGGALVNSGRVLVPASQVQGVDAGAENGDTDDGE